MLEGRYQRGFSPERLKTPGDHRIRKDETGFFIMSLSENSKVYFDDFYRFLEMAYERALADKESCLSKLDAADPGMLELNSYYRARVVIMEVVLRTARRFYTDGANLSVIMTPWCFGTVVLEKIEVYRDRLAKGEVQDPHVPEYPFYVVKYVDEIYKTTLLELFDFPETAFQMRWQYSELLKRYSKILTNISSSLQSVMKTIKTYGQ